ncbi:hypothetical protein BS50DRAFT_322434 [Corynespora cassiicola Philippines]|uniref:DNA/RNA-binding protein Alba-like domain-containing protein n=1 Tax=Corynespora cassiicola Philippines TaxID=1448308 RepID=A0A2T2NTH4_CORCC|nr:hypothetical protein BS50DRAFT_322434 [Corynespora cassiicola Philippines]
MPSPQLFPPSEKEGGTTMPTETTITSSDGPTLPIIGATTEHANTTAPATQPAPSTTTNPAKPSSQRPTKKQKVAPTDPNPAAPERAPNPELEPLRAPWMLLPAELRAAADKRLSAGGEETAWSARCVPVVFTRNQNVRAGINRLKTYLGAYRNPASSIEMPDALGREDLLIAVSAMGEATVKLVGILEMVRRVVGVREGQAGDVRIWYMYTVLGSQSVVKKARKDVGKDGGEKEDKMELDEEETFVPLDSVREAKSETKKVPVLTVWLAKKPVPELKNAFGEQTFQATSIQEGG